jgi:hypothetical protein
MCNFCDGHVEALFIGFVFNSVNVETLKHCNNFANQISYDFAQDHN